MGRMKRLWWLLPLSAFSALTWLAWPLLRPALWPATGPSWLVVLDGYHRLDAVLRRREPILLITCPATGQPTAAQRGQRPSLQVLHQGFDTATQAVALRAGNSAASSRALPLPIRSCW
jgi:hypothetical protein